VIVPETVKYLNDDAEQGRISLASASTDDIQVVAAAFAGRVELHDGELEALTLLVRDVAYQDCFFCSADGAPIEAAAMLELDERCMSVESLLAKIGLTKPLESKYTEEFMRRHLKDGLIARVTGGKVSPF
jgi:hypothetical protein